MVLLRIRNSLQMHETPVDCDRQPYKQLIYQ
jgi:hypothetical protein